MKKGHLLIIDDEAHLLNVLSFMLSPHAEKISTFENPSDALKIIDTEKVDCIISDINLPRISGMDILKFMRSRGLETSFIFFTTDGRTESMEEAVKFGVKGYFFKPQFTGIEAAVIAALNNVPYEPDPASEFGRLLLASKS